MDKSLADIKIKNFSKEDVLDLMDYGFSENEIRKGYEIFESSDIMGGALHVEKWDIIDRFDSDEDAYIYAKEHDKIKFIENIPLDAIDECDRGYFIDTAENRVLISEYLKKKYGITI